MKVLSWAHLMKIIIDQNNSKQRIDRFLAKELFSFPFVDRVFFAGNFITVTKKEPVEWLEIQSKLKDYIKKYLEEGKPVIEIKDIS